MLAINLLPWRIAVYSGVFLVAMVSYGLFLLNHKRQLEQQWRHYLAEEVSLSHAISHYASLNKAYQAQQDSAGRHADYRRERLALQTFWLSIMARLPDDLWLAQVEVAPDNWSIKGQSRDYLSILHFYQSSHALATSSRITAIEFVDDRFLFTLEGLR